MIQIPSLDWPFSLSSNENAFPLSENFRPFFFFTNLVLGTSKTVSFFCRRILVNVQALKPFAAPAFPFEVPSLCSGPMSCFTSMSKPQTSLSSPVPVAHALPSKAFFFTIPPAVWMISLFPGPHPTELSPFRAGFSLPSSTGKETRLLPFSGFAFLFPSPSLSSQVRYRPPVP